ncbi:MAG: CRISPR system precrRNA processing endoribonuclease RAMP protein Cas6 [candidate division WOR-3 bacterium]|nr:CRISPR system precrRNA processing endoribonuclease RAMP protein Cas6 [candidate division WOR-3 bacterium]MCX7836561.1 CRISPR system precrRNA processing endoribonuclease RAMP protein Cas6 [candidate division WOR-3 bacterium]MDW8113906.1 CRISPR system precrRNA processing endoribonuclease RAMP protein Cas6 [candidate division WOR-3 bacterium]
MKIAELTIYFKVKKDLNLPAYKGSILRGAFGYALRKVCCPFSSRDCKECLLKPKCVYIYIFETQRPENSAIMRKYENIPHPFIIEPPLDNKTEYKEGDLLSFNFILLGKAIEFLPYFIYAFEHMAERGLNKGRNKLVIQSIKQGDDIIYDGESKIIKNKVKEKELKLKKPKKLVNRIAIKFLTPVRIIYQGKVAESLDFSIILRSLIRRIGLLSYFYSQKPFEIEFKELIEQALQIKTEEAKFKRIVLSRYSFRQRRLIKMEGLIGEAIYQGNLSQFIPYLKIGEKLHIGKGTTFGLGKYQLKILS